MNELKPYIPKIKKYFANVISKYSMGVKKFGDHEVWLIGRDCTIKITTQRYYVDLQAVFVGGLEQTKVSITEIMEKKNLLGKEILDDSDAEACDALSDEIESGIFFFSLIIERYFQDVLDGSYFDRIDKN